MSKIIPAIVVIAYNRSTSLERLLTSLSNANYSESNIPLIISIDFGEDNHEVLKLAQNFIWNFGSKKIIEHKENLGLRKHVIKCGDLSTVYHSIILLEDDLFVSPNFYSYTITALDFAKSNPFIAGISLYNHPTNVHTNEVFRPLDDGYDNYYFQFASSWGQAWTKEQWSQFKAWYAENQIVNPDNQIPKNVTNWSDKSWLKYFTIFLIKNNKYFLYPKVSLSTNFSDVGTHVGSDSTSYQTALSFAENYNAKFSTFEKSRSIYDAFYENMQLHKSLKVKVDDLCIDLYGYKPTTNRKFWLTSQIKDFKILHAYGRSLKPIDANVIGNIKGSDIFLYDTSQQELNVYTNQNYRRISYSIGHLSIKNSLIVTRKLLTLKIKAKFGIK